MTGPRVALVAVSHSAALAAGVAELAAQMAPNVTIIGVGGSDGGLGTSFDAITDALQGAGSAAGIVVLYDLGSARLTTETAIEFLDPQVAGRIEIVDAPLAEGTIAAAVEAESGADRAAVAAAARSAAAAPAGDAVAGDVVADGEGTVGGGATRTEPAAHPTAPVLTRPVRLRNKLGLHARPVAELIRQLAGLDAQVRIGRSGQPATDLRSLLGVVSLAIRGGETADLSASGPDAETALDRLEGLIEAGFGEEDAGAPGSGSAQPRIPRRPGPLARPSQRPRRQRRYAARPAARSGPRSGWQCRTSQSAPVPARTGSAAA